MAQLRAAIPPPPRIQFDEHYFGGRLFYDPNRRLMRVVTFTDGRLTCEECGPPQRKDLTRIIRSGFSDRPMFLLVADPGEVDTVMRQLRRKQAHALIVPTEHRRIVLSDQPVTGRGGQRRSVCVRGRLQRIVREMTAKAWYRDRSHRLASIPRGWRAELAEEVADWLPDEAKDPAALPWVDLGTIGRPDQFIHGLEEAGVHCREPGQVSEIHALWCDRRFQNLLQAHRYRKPERLVIPPELMRGHSNWERQRGEVLP